MTRVTEPLVDVTGARRRRARARLLRRVRIAGVLVALVALVGGAAWLMGWSSVFSADEVATEGLVVLTHDEVVAAAQVPLGQPLARIETDEIAERVRELPPVADVRVGVRFPHTVTVAVTEREPVIALEIGRNYVSVDAEGVPFHSGTERPDGVLLARGSAINDTELLAGLATVAASLPPPVRDLVDVIGADTLDSITLTLTDGRRIVWGGPEDSELKGRVVQPLLGVSGRVLDVSAPSHPTSR
ncbi:cell division protein FtsQ/DivIB [Propioniciclava soli]|uniref:cell division protein FtsQ/DivIB n=1 Tax=Propioniciclava soli TaxID=2775081 RepID=UPI001E370B64|nr:FtsQ-type POTRA domain-containing protein [Propioniciclava soli]